MRQIQLLIAIIFCVISSKADVTAVFDWSTPTSLTPAYSAPTSSDRYGEYISNIEFSDNGVTFLINDDAVSESSRKARFVYGYLTQTVEMRAYLDSDIIITAPEGMCVHQVIFEGAKVDDNYMLSYDDDSTFVDGNWIAGTDAREAKFYVGATINCTKTTVICTEGSGVGDIIADNAAASAEWYTLDGRKLSHNPTLSGVYIKRIGNTAKSILIR